MYTTHYGSRSYIYKYIFVRMQARKCIVIAEINHRTRRCGTKGLTNQPDILLSHIVILVHFVRYCTCQKKHPSAGWLIWCNGVGSIFCRHHHRTEVTAFIHFDWMPEKVQDFLRCSSVLFILFFGVRSPWEQSLCSKFQPEVNGSHRWRTYNLWGHQ